MWLSLVERYVRDVEAAGSNPVISTKTKKDTEGVLFRFVLNMEGFERRAVVN